MVMMAGEAEIKEGYNLTEAGVIPKDWEAKSIGELVTFSGGSQPPRSTFKFQKRDEYIRLIQIRDYKTDEFETYIPEEFARKKCTADDIMIGRYGPPIFQILRGIEGAYNVALLKAIPSSRIDREYLYHFLKQNSLFRYIELLSQRSSGQTGVEMPALKNYPLPLPPLPEQQVIATALSDIDALITSLDKLIVKKRDIKQATMQQLLTGKTRLVGFGKGLKQSYKQTEAGLIPEDWKVTTLGEVAHVKTGPFGSSLHEKDYVDDGTPIITVEHLSEQGIVYVNLPMVSDDDRKRLSAYSLLAGDIVFSRVGSVDRNSLVKKEESGWLFSGRLLRIRLKVSYLYSPFLSYYFNQEATKQRIRSVAVGQTMASLNTHILKNIDIAFPSNRSEQQAIATVLSDMDTEIAALEHKREKTRMMKQGMMQELLTGKIRLV